MPQPLSSKEQSLFRQVVKNYEAKQYKKGLKAAEQILRKSPNHGDTQAMKALLLSAIGQTDEAFGLAKVALKNDMKSHVCWHVYGLLYRSQKNFEEAIKAYKFALKLEPESAQILRDLALLQVQMRDYPGYIQSRKLILQARPQLRQNWTAMAVAHHLAGELSAAENVLKTYEDTLKTTPPKTDIEHSEAVLYKNSVIAEMGELDRALTHLESISKNSLDRTAVMEMRADYLLRLGRKEDAIRAYEDLITRNPDNYAYLEGLEKALGFQRSQKKELRKMYEDCSEKHDGSDAARRIPLNFLDGSDFKEVADLYLRRMLRKGVPSTFNNIKSLYTDVEKRQIVETLVEGYASEKPVNGSADDAEALKRFQEAVYYFLAQHYNYKLSRNLKKASQYTEKAAELSPKKYDYLMTKARIHKHLGNPVEAAKLMEQARQLDPKDRYINTKCAKYQLRNEENDEALKTMSKFTRNEGVGGTLGDLLDMQVLWYLTEDGEAYARQKNYNLALKRLHSVYDIFETWQEDQFDFHSFSFRKGQVRAYVDMIRWEDRLREHPFYIKAAIAAAKVYIAIADGALDDTAKNGDGVDDAERKKALKKAKKEQERLEREDAERREADRKAAAKKTPDGDVKKPDPDPRGLKLLETTEPLEVAMRFLSPLLELGIENAEAQHVGFEVSIRRGKHYLALKCLAQAFKLDGADSKAHAQAIRFLQSLKQNPEHATPHLTQFIKTALPAPYNDPSASLSSINDSVLSKHPQSAAHTFGHIRARQTLDASTLSQNLSGVTKALKESKNVSLAEVVNGTDLLKELKAGKDAWAPYVAAAKDLYPDAGPLFDREAAR